MRAKMDMSGPFRPSGLPFPSQCSSRSRMPSATRSEKRICRAMSAPRWQRVSISSRAMRPPFCTMFSIAWKRSASPAFNPGMREDEAQHLGKAVADALEVPFEVEIVGQIQLAYARGVAAAAEILQEQRIEERRLVGLRQADLLSDVDADPAAAHAMPRRLALGHVERVAERAEQLRQADFAGSAALWKRRHRGYRRHARARRRCLADEFHRIGHAGSLGPQSLIRA